MADCIHSAIAPNMDRCIKCGAWVGLGPEPAASGGDSASLELERFGRAPAGSPYLLVPMSDGYWTPWHIAQKALNDSRLNEPFGNPEQFDVNEQSGNSRQLPSLERRGPAEELLRLYAEPIPVAVEDGAWFMVREQDALDAITAALANQQGVETDAARYRWLRDSRACSLEVSFNDHHNMYMSVADTLENLQEYYDDISAAEREKMVATDTIWTVHIYPNTPVGFNVYHAATLDAAIDAAMSTQPAGDVGSGEP